MLIYHITERAAWKQAQTEGHYSPPSLTSEGFIHASTRDQVSDTANRYYRGLHGLALLVIDLDNVRPTVRFDTVFHDGDEMKFPHIYGPLNLDAVVDVLPFEPDETGAFRF